LEQAQQCAQTQVPVSSDYQVLDRSLGRLVERRIHVFDAPPKLSQDWASLAAFVSVERSGIRDGQFFQRQSWFILSQIIPAQRAAQLIQPTFRTSNSSINRLHLVKTKSYKFDADVKPKKK